MNPFSALALFCLCAAGSGLLVRMAFRNAPQCGPIPHLLSAVTLFFAFLIGSFLLTGYIELITGIAVVSTTSVASVAFVALAVIMLCSREAGRHPLYSCYAGCAQVIAALQGALRAVGTGGARTLVLSAAALVAVLAISTFIIGFPRGTESVAYHLPNGLAALQSGSLHLSDGSFNSALHANAGIWYAFLLSFLPERFVAMGELAFLPVLVLALYGIARRTGADARGSAFAAIGILSIPIITLQATLAESDVAGLTFIAIALYFLVSFELPKARYLLVGLGIGLAFGFKSLYIMAGGILVAAVIAEPWWRRADQGVAWQRERWYRSTGIALAAALLMGSFWPTRNFLETGNPLYPIYVRHLFDAFGWPPAWDVDYAFIATVQSNHVMSTWDWPLYPWKEWYYNFPGPSYKSNSGLGAFFAAAVPLAWVHTTAGLIFRAKRGGWDDACKVRLMLLSAGTLLLIVWFLLGDREPRYASAALAFLVPLVGFTIFSVTARPRILLEGLLWICIGWMFLSFLTQELVTFGDRIVYSRQFSRDKYYEYPPEVDRLPKGATIVNLVDRSTNYMLVGSRHTNRVVNYLWSVRTFGIDVTPKSSHLLSIEKDTKGIFLGTASLRKLGATHVYVRSKADIGRDACVRLRELNRIERNPVSGARIDPPKVLYEIDYCKTPAG